MTKVVRGVVFALLEDKEHEGEARVWVRDAATDYWFSLSRAADSDTIELMVSDQLTYVGSDLRVALSPSAINVAIGDSAATLDGHREYLIEFHPESHDVATVGSVLKVIFRGQPGLQLDI
ncbi:hypothetical protein [Inhella proteolytica]|uniref:Uncharacterized protein n=1 Tax=Inhella proteolytica TaxID=2795029 RepID=A0A931J807_9BURK|nr:hypothetical protein [Inhella proteolytica]MBH9579239.1 hypothetical protein [Inhella proteolytica]